VSERIHLRGSHTYHDFSKRASPEHVADVVLLFLVGRRRLRHDLLGDEREHLVVVALIVSESVTMLSLDVQVVSSVEQEMEDVDAQVVVMATICRCRSGKG